MSKFFVCSYCGAEWDEQPSLHVCPALANEQKVCREASPRRLEHPATLYEYEQWRERLDGPSSEELRSRNHAR